MFIVKKKIKGRKYYYARESKRENGRVVAKTIAYLGKTKKDAEKKLEKILKQKKRGKKMNDEKTKLVKKKISIDEMANFCKRKGFVFRSSDIYGGFAGFWDFGPFGIELFNNIKQNWWKFFVQEKDNMVGIEASVISHPKTWEASGHLTSFADVAVVCKKCKKSTKLDKSEVGKVKCECGGDYESQGEFNLLFKTKVGALNSEDSYLRGETAQGMFMDFKLVQETARKQLPFGIAQIGKCFRNEIAPRDFLFRSREFNIAEFEFFIHPDEVKCGLLDRKHLNVKIRLLDAETQEAGKEEVKETTIGRMIEEKRLDEWHGYWLAEQILWYGSLDLKEIKIREHTKDELSHYSSATFDIDYEYAFGSKELGGIANRGQYDLKQHGKESGKDMSVFDEKTKQKVVPRVIEPTFGMERVFLAVLSNGYYYDEKRDNIVLKLPVNLAPVKAAVFPLVKNDKRLVKIAREVYDELKKDFYVVYDESGSVGRRYSRNDEIGTPFCITIDSDSINGKDVTIRDRDTTKQVRVKICDLKNVLRDLINGSEFSGDIIETRKK